MLTSLFDEAEARGEARGIMIGETNGAIKEAVKLYDEEMNLSPSEIIKKIMARFSLNKEDAEKYVETTLNLEII